LIINKLISQLISFELIYSSSLLSIPRGTQAADNNPPHYLTLSLLLHVSPGYL